MMKGGMGNLMKQAQEMQEKMQKAQEEVAKAEVHGEAGAGMIKVTMNGRHDVLKVDIDPSVMEEDKELLEDLLAAAVNDAVRKVEANSKEMMEDATSGLTARLQDAVLKRLADERKAREMSARVALVSSHDETRVLNDP